MSANIATWLRILKTDAARKGIANRVSRRSAEVWLYIWTEGVPPTVESVLAWAKGDPVRFSILRLTEEGLPRKVLANERARERNREFESLERAA